MRAETGEVSAAGRRRGLDDGARGSTRGLAWSRSCNGAVASTARAAATTALDRLALGGVLVGEIQKHHNIGQRCSVRRRVRQREEHRPIRARRRNEGRLDAVEEVGKIGPGERQSGDVAPSTPRQFLQCSRERAVPAVIGNRPK